MRPGNAVSQFIDKHIIEAGEAKQSDVVKAENARYAQEMQEAQGIGDEVGATLRYAARNPLLAAAQAAGSFAGPGLAIKGATKAAQAAGLGAKATTRAGLAAGSGFGAAAAGGDAAGTAYDLAKQGGASEDQAVAAGRQASLIPAAIGAAGGLVGAERLVAGAKGFGGGLVSRALKTGAVEGAQEAIEEGVTQYEGQRAAVPYHQGLDPLKGVAGAATLGFVLGGVTGAGVSLLNRQHQAVARKPSEELGLNPDNGPVSKAVAAAVDEGRAAQPVQQAAPEDGLSLAPLERDGQPSGPTLEQRVATLPERARAQADQLLREIGDERVPVGVKRYRAMELQQLLDAHPAPQNLNLDIPEEERIAMRPIVRGYDPATGLVPEQPLTMADGQAQYDGGIDFSLDAQPTQDEYQEAINRIALENDQPPGNSLSLEQASRLRDAAQQQGIPATIVPHPSGVGFDVQATAVLPEDLRRQVPQDPAAAALPFDNRETGRIVADAQGNARAERRPEVVEREVRWNQERAQANAEYQRRAELGLSNLVRVTPTTDAAAQQGSLSPVGRTGPAEQAAPEQPVDLQFQASTGRGLVQRAGLGVEHAPLDVQATEVRDPAIGMTGRLTGPDARTGAEQKAQGLAAGNEQAAVPNIAGEAVGRGWRAFTPESGTLGIPRADMPQIPAERRGALVNYLKVQGVESRAGEVPALSLKPTQAEFSEDKVRAAMQRKGGERSVLVSADGYVVDGHHQWLAKREDGQPVKVLQLQAPIAQLLPLISSFPSVRSAQGALSPTSTTQQTRNALPQTTAPALLQPAGGINGAQTSQTQPSGAQPQAPGAAAAESNGQTVKASPRAAGGGRQRTAGDLARARSYEANPFRAFLGKHGVKIDARSEFAPGLKEIRGALVPGYGPIFRKNGKQLDALVQNAVEEGFLPADATEADLYNLIDQAVRQGQKVVPLYAEGAAEAEFEAMAARQAQLDREAYEAALAAQQAEDAEYEAVLAQEFVGLTDEEYAALEAGVPELNATSNTSLEDAMRALGFTEQEIQDAITQQSAVSQESGRSAGQAGSTDTRGTPARDSAGQGFAQREEVLTAYTRDEVLARQEAQAKAEAERSKADREAEHRAQADRERAEFTLTGSDRAADANPNQGDFFSQHSQSGADSGATSPPKKAAPEATAGATEKAPAAPKQVAQRSARRIEDVGEKIGGARKDVWSGFRDDLRAVSDDQVAAQPLSKVWPHPDYQKLIDNGHDARTVALVRALRDAVPTKPRQSYKVNRWAEQVQTLRGFATELMDGKLSHQQVLEALKHHGSREVNRVVGRAELYEAVGHGQSLEGVTLEEHFYSLYRGRPNVRLWAVEKAPTSSSFSSWPQELATGDTKEQAIEAFKRLLARKGEQAAKPAAPSFDIWAIRRTGEYFVGKKIGRNYAELAGPFQTAREARAYRDEHEAELTAKLEKFKEIPQERADTNRPRVGQDMRQGQDVTPQQFRETFGFRGVEFGNWVEQSRRQKDLNDAYDALMDLAAILGVPPKALSLNGELGLAFGARGAGGKHAAAAHYERGKVVINLTKKSGAGSLGHEWWHAVDNYFSRMRGQADGMLTEASDVQALTRGATKTFPPNGNVRPEMVQAFAEVIRAINKTSLRARAAHLDSRRVKEYWGTDPELSARAFESYLIAKLEDQNASNDYLANVVDEKVWDVQAALGMQLEDSYPYAKAGEVPVIRAAFDHFFRTVETRVTDQGVAMFSRTERPVVAKPSAVQLRRAMVQRTVDALIRTWAQAPTITVVDSMQDARVPEQVREADAAQRSQGAMGEPEGFWYQGQVYLVAGALSSSADAARVIYHEVLGHHGLRGKFGDKLDKVLDQVAKLRAADVHAKAQEYGLDLGNSDHVAYAAEEVLAEMAQTRPDLGFVQRAISAIRNFLRNHVPGFKHLRLTDADIIQGYILPARGWVERADVVAARAETAAAFARHPGFSAAVDAAIQAGQRGETGNGQHIEIATLPTALAVAGIPDGNLRTSARVLQKVVFDHGVPANVLKRLPELLEAPVMVLRSDSVDGRFVVVTSEMVRGSPLVVAISPEVTRGNVALNFVPSLYPKDDLKAIQRWLNGGRSGTKLLTYLDQKQSPKWFGSTGLQLPSEYRTTQGLLENNVATEKTAVNGESGNERFSRSQPAAEIASSMGVLTPDQERAYRAVAGFAKVPSLRERFESFKANFGLRMKQALVDQFAPIAQLDQKAYMLARMSKGSDGTLEAALLYGRPFLRDGVPDVDIKEGGFAKVLASLQGEHDRFLMWVAAHRAERLKGEGKENLFTDQDISSLKTLDAGSMPDGSSRKQAYAKALAQLNGFNESVLRMARESGLIDQASYDLMKDQPYVPFYRLMEEEGGLQGPSFSKGLVNQQAWKKLKGGSEQLNADLLQNMLLNWGNLYAAAARNRAALATMDAADKLAIAYRVTSDTKGAVKVMRDGMTEYWMVEDPYLLEAISALHYQSSPLMKPLSRAKHWLTLGVTVNPTFKVRNLIRDVISSMAMADLGFNPADNLRRGWKLTASDSQVYASMLASGGLIKFGTQEHTDRVRKQVAKLSGVVLDQNAAQKLWGKVKALYAVYDELGDRTENVNRAALYDRLIQKGYSHADAAFMARDLMDFSMSGSAPVVRFLTQSVPFLNARLQGLYKLGRAAKADPRRFAMVAMAVSMASLGLLAAYADDEDWKRREDWDRDSYWWFKIGDTAYRIPKPFEVGAIGTLAERVAEAMFSEEMDSKRFMDRISHMVSQTFAFDPVPQAVKPLLDIYANKDSFTGRAIESMADQRLRPQDRYNERTSEVARFLGQLGLPDPAQLIKGEYVGLSPKQIDHLLHGYFSWMATAATTASDTLLRNTVVDRGEAPDLRLKDMLLVGNFAESLPAGGSRYVTALYEQSRAIEQAYASYQDALKSGERDKAAEIMESEGSKIRSRGSVAAATKLLSQLNAQAKRVQEDPVMSGEEKRARLTRIEQRRHEIAKRVMGGG